MTEPDVDARVNRWLAALEARHLSDLTFPEVSRALRALSSLYVERRAKIGHGAALDGAGKRAAFALFYGPLHLLLVRHIVSALGASIESGRTIVDAGCGTGVAGAAWSLASEGDPLLLGIDRNAWAAREAGWTWHALGLRGHAATGDATRMRLPRGPLAIVASFAVNEWAPDVRATFRDRLRAAASEGHALLVVEPLAGGIAPWWREWADAFQAAGGRSDEWRVRAMLPEIVRRLDHAAGLDHREITGRSLYVPPRQGRRS